MAKPSRGDGLNGMIISDTSIRQPVLITMIMLLVVVIGLLSYRTLPVNLLPDISVPVVAVTVTYPGAGPESVAEQVAEPIEDTINTISGVEHITSSSSEGFTQIIVQFLSEINPDEAEQNVREKVNAVLPQLPTGINDPVFLKFDPNDQPIMTLAVAGDGSRSPLELRQLIDNDIVPRLQRVQGVGSVTVTGGEKRQINVQMDLNKLNAYHILPAQITRSIQAANNAYGLGSINANNVDISLRAPSQIQAPQDIGRIQITGTAFRVSDIASIQDGVAERTSYARLDGKEAITLEIRKQTGTNTVGVADATKAEIQQIFTGRPDLTYFLPNDQSTSVRGSTDSAIEELLIASVSAMLIVLLFFRDLRNTLVTVAGLPVILIGTFAALTFFGLTINLLSLLALSLSVGLVIDDAIVVRENIFRRMELGDSPRVAASRGTGEVALSVLAMTLTIIAVFVPVTFASGTAGIVFKTFGITVASAMAISLVEAFTLAPMMSAYLFKQHAPKKGAAHAQPHDPSVSTELHEANEDPGLFGRTYGRLLEWSLRHRALIVIVAVAVLVGSGFVATQLKFQFLPQQDQHFFTMQFELPPGTPLAETDRIAKQTEATLLQNNVIEAVVSTVGFTGNPERASFFVRLKGKTPTLATQAQLRQQLSALPRLAFGQPSFTGTGADVSARPLQLSIQTTRSLDELAPLLQQLQTDAQAVPGLVDIDSTYKPGKPEIRFYVDPAKTGSLGITNDDIATSVRALINGSTATVFRQNGQDTDIVVRLQSGDRADVGNLGSISVPTQTGNVPLSSLVTVETGSSSATIRRYDRLNQVLVGANVVGRNINDVQTDLNARITAFRATLPQDVSNDIFISYTGQTQQSNEGFGSLFIAMGLSVLFVYMVLASQFGSFLQPLVIMMAMPFSFIGAFMALLITGIDLDITGMIGLILLLGLVTKNSILLVDLTNRLRRAGMEKHLAIERAGAVRLRPILMTTLALVAGALPTAIGLHFFSSGEGSDFRRGLAIVQIGGLITSMVLTLLVVPVAYSLLESFTQRMGRLFGRTPTLEPTLAGSAAEGLDVPAGQAPVVQVEDTPTANHGGQHARAYDTSGKQPNGIANNTVQPIVPTSSDTQKHT